VCLYGFYQSHYWSLDLRLSVLKSLLRPTEELYSGLSLVSVVFVSRTVRDQYVITCLRVGLSMKLNLSDSECKNIVKIGMSGRHIVNRVLSYSSLFAFQPRNITSQ
jgi:hypothetical protein